MKIACLFAGQGAQYPGMGRDLYERYPKSRQVFDAAGDRIKNLCFEGTAEELKLTENTQPCVYAVTMAAYEEFISRFEAEKPEDAEIAAMAGLAVLSICFIGEIIKLARSKNNIGERLKEGC